MTKVLITGGAGFIGSHVTERLLSEGDEVVVVDNFSTARRDSLEPHERLTVVEGTIADPELVERAFAFGPEVVLHAAASYKDPVAWGEDARTNVVGSANVVQAAERAGAARIVYLQTALCYGRPRQVPIPIDHPLAPFTSYGISKAAGESYLLLACRSCHCGSPTSPGPPAIRPASTPAGGRRYRPRSRATSRR